VFGMGYVPFGYISHVAINTKFGGSSDAECKRRKFKNVCYTDVRMKFRKDFTVMGGADQSRL
jgi:hypothetical protein